ncbi:MAG: sulfite exporter TauE/SafE family protein [Burkholderiaceae bacterium]
MLASQSQLRGISRDIDWPWLKWLALGNLLFIPLGIALLAWMPETPLRLLISVLLMAAVILLRTGHRAEMQVTPGVRFGTGLASGFINGVAAIGGISLAALLSAARMTPAALRATLIALLLFSDLVSLACAALMPSASVASTGLLGMDTLKWAAWLTPGMLAGIWFGQSHFIHVSPELFCRYVLNLLILLAAVRAVFSRP